MKRSYDELGKAMHYLKDTCEDFLILGDFDNDENEHDISNFLGAYGPKI